MKNSTNNEEFNELVSNYFGYTGYYINDFMEDLDDEFIDTFISELGIYLSLNDNVEAGMLSLNQSTMNILNKISSQL